MHLAHQLTNEKDITPLIYTPTVGEACQRWSELYTQPEGKQLDLLKYDHVSDSYQVFTCLSRTRDTSTL
jgi:malic enzyme